MNTSTFFLLSSFSSVSLLLRATSQSQASAFASTKLAEAELAYINADYQKVNNLYL